MTRHENLVWYRKLPRIIWEDYYRKFNKRFYDSFAVSYDKNLKELYWIEAKLFDSAPEDKRAK